MHNKRGLRCIEINYSQLSRIKLLNNFIIRNKIDENFEGHQIYLKSIKLHYQINFKLKLINYIIIYH